MLFLLDTTGFRGLAPKAEVQINSFSLLPIDLRRVKKRVDPGVDAKT